MKKKLIFGGREIEGNLEEFDFSKYFDDPNLTDALVMYNATSNTITVDTRASEKYKEFAFVHESICCGYYSDLAPVVSDKKQRCLAIDQMIIDSIKDESERLEYIKKRIDMFSTLLSDKKYGAQGVPMFVTALEGLKKLV